MEEADAKEFFLILHNKGSEAAINQGIFTYIYNNLEQFPEWTCFLLAKLARGGQQHAIVASGLLDAFYDIAMRTTSHELLSLLETMLEDIVNDGFVGVIGFLCFCLRRLGYIDYMYKIQKF